MPFENEFASYEPLRRILNNEKVQDFQKRFKVRKSEESEEQVSEDGLLVKKSQLALSHWQPDWVLAIDGSYHAVKAKNGFPGAELGYLTLASVLIFLDKIRELEKQEFIDPREFRETEKASTIESVYPGCNVIIDEEDSAKSSMRKMLFEELKNHVIFSEGETLLDTYEALLKIKREKNADAKPPRCPCELERDFKYGYGKYPCSNGQCDKILYSTDAMRLHELLNPSGTCGEMYGQIMFTLERLWLVHILRAFEHKNWLSTLRRIAFIMDGSLAVYSTPSWLAKPISDELRRINELQKKTNGQDLIILGIEKSGNFVNHFADLDMSSEGVKGKLPNETAILLTDEYIKKNIIFSESPKPYGLDTYFGRKFLRLNWDIGSLQIWFVTRILNEISQQLLRNSFQDLQT